jgi:type IV pilus assembly protein PilA
VANRRSRGFTLIEMMIVVVIVGVVATLAVVGYRKIVQSAHVSEGTSMVQNIRVAQEAYHSETQQYANVSKDLTQSWYPATPHYQIQTAWGADCSAVCNSGMQWTALPLHIDGPLLFGYATVAYPASTNPSTIPLSYANASLTLPQSVPTDWYVVAAVADLDGDSTTATLVVGVSWSNQLQVVNEGQ